MSTFKSKYVNVSPDAIRSARMERGLSVMQLAALARVGRTTINNIEHEITQQLKVENAERLAHALRVKVKDITDDAEVVVRNAALGALGLMEAPASANEDVPFQSFEATRGNQPIAFSWADSGGQTLIPRTIDRQGHENRLELEFSGTQNSTASIVAIAPEAFTPRKLTFNQRAIGFAARILKNSARGKLTIGVRLVDRKAREWVLGDSTVFGGINQQHLFCLEGHGIWTPCIIRLTALATAEHKWYLFRTTSADRSAKLRPDWSVIARVHLEVGSWDAKEHRSPGIGKIALSPIWVGTPQSIQKRLPTKKSQ